MGREAKSTSKNAIETDKQKNKRRKLREKLREKKMTVSQSKSS